MEKSKSTHASESAHQGFKDVKQLRKDLKLRPISSGEIACLACDGLFFSKNLTANKICNKCKRNGSFNG